MRNQISKDSTSGGVSVIHPEARQQPHSEVVAIAKASAKALAGFAVLYIVFFSLYSRFPNLRPGDNLVAEFKHSQARNGNLFRTPKGPPTGNPDTGRMHVMAFGYSKTLAGFIPAVFDSEMASAGFPAIESYNFGLPGDSLFVDDLKAMAAHGTAPDIALLTFTWVAAPAPAPTFFHFIRNDKEVMDELFPFRHLPRDFLIMLTQAHGLRAFKSEYLRSERSVEQVATDRGYFFIARQSHFKNDELPADYRQPTDTPNAPDQRVIKLDPIYESLAPVLAAHKIQCIFVPKYYRVGEFAPVPSPNPASAKTLAGQPNVDIIGPDYWLYPNRLFSDQTHANRPGAHLYTQAIAQLVADWLKHHKTPSQ